MWGDEVLTGTVKKGTTGVVSLLQGSLGVSQSPTSKTVVSRLVNHTRSVIKSVTRFVFGFFSAPRTRVPSKIRSPPFSVICLFLCVRISVYFSHCLSCRTLLTPVFPPLGEFLLPQSLQRDSLLDIRLWTFHSYPVSCSAQLFLTDTGNMFDPCISTGLVSEREFLNCKT